MTPESSLWADLPPDLLLDISGRLHHVTDFVRFHAVCTPWRATVGLRSPSTRHKFSPWLLGLSNDYHSDTIDCTARFPCVSAASKSVSDRHFTVPEPPGTFPSGCGKGSNWVGRADGMAACIFSMDPGPRLVDLLTGAVTPLARFPDYDDDDVEIKRSMKSIHGIVYSDGTVILYTSLYDDRTSVFTVAVLRPGDAAWTLMKVNPDGRPYCVAYHKGKVLMCIGNGKHPWFVLTQDGVGAASINGGSIRKRGYVRNATHVMESHGKLLLASVFLHVHWFHNISSGSTPEVLVRLHELEEEEAGGEMRWVTRDNRRFDDRVLFLGYPTSCAMDASELGMDGGCAYFVFDHHLVKYSFADDETEVVDWRFVRPIDYGARVWLQPPRPHIAPIREIQDKLQEARPQAW